MTDFTYTGTIQLDTITSSGEYAITLEGAQGGGSNGGLGAKVSGDIYLQAGDVLEIVVGGEGGEGSQSFFAGGGGGGSFIIETATSSGTLSSPIIEAVAGGGGGGVGGHAGEGGRPTQTGGIGSGLNSGNGGGPDQGGGGGINGGGGGGFTGGSGGNSNGAGGFTGGGQGTVSGMSFAGGAAGNFAQDQSFDGPSTSGAGGFGGGGGGGSVFGGGGGGGGGYGGGGGGGFTTAGGGGGAYNTVGGGGTSGGVGGGGGGSYLDSVATNRAITGGSSGGNSGDGFVSLVEMACFRRGTRILTPGGEICVEDLAVGDLVMTRDHGAQPIVWRGHRRVDCADHPAPHNIWPVRIQRGAFADAVPARDLYLSPDHAIYCDGVLIEAKRLVNGASIAQIPCETVEYWHLELATHDILLAEGLPAETYLDTGNRTAFAGGAVHALHPDFAAKHWADTCVPLVFGGEALHRTKAHLLARAAALGHRLTAEDDAHILADGQRIDPIRLSPTRTAFLLPPGAAIIELRSRRFVPAHAKPESQDTRTLGLCIKRLQRDGTDIPLDDDSLFTTGWSRFERPATAPAQRWTTGTTPLPAGTRLIVLDHAGPGHYWAPQAQDALTLAA